MKLEDKLVEQRETIIILNNTSELDIHEICDHVLAD